MQYILLKSIWHLSEYIKNKKEQNLSGQSEKFWVLQYPLKSIFIVAGVLVLVAIAFVLWGGYLLFGSDPCNDWRPSMTKSEKILMALESANKSNSLSFEFISSQDGKIYRGLAKQVPFKNVETILREQPNCCRVYEQDSALTDDPKPLNESLRGDEGVVVLRYMGKYRDRHTGLIHTAPTFTYLNFNICRSKKEKF